MEESIPGWRPVDLRDRSVVDGHDDVTVLDAGALCGVVGAAAFFGPVGSDSIYVINDSDASFFDNHSADGYVDFLGQEVFLVLSLRDDDGRMLTSRALPLVPPSLDLAELAEFKLTSNDAPLAVVGDLTSLTLVPEPGSLSSLAIGAFTLLRVGCGNSTAGRAGVDNRVPRRAEPALRAKVGAIGRAGGGRTHRVGRG